MKSRKQTEKVKTAAPAGKSARRSAEWFIPIVLVLAAAIAYSNSFAGPFIFDDFPSTTENPHIRHLWPLTEAASAVPQTATAGRPVVALSLTLNYAVGGLNVWGYHAVNLAIHLLAALALFGLVRRTLDAGLDAALDASHAWLAGSVALIWELHPLSTEAVDYIVQRTESMASLFLLLTLYCLARGSASVQGWRWYGAGIAACGLGMGSKEIMAGAPLIALLYDRVFLSESWLKLWRLRRYVHLGLAATWTILIAEIAAGSRSDTVGFEFSTLSSWDYLKTQCGAIVYYIRLSLWPSPLSIDYFDWPVAKAPLWTLPAAAVMLILAGLTLWALLRKPWLGFLGSCFFIILAPSSSFVPIVSELVAERRMYLPLAAIVSIVVIGGYSLVRQAAPRIVLLALVLSLAGVLGTATYRRNADYRTEVAIWRDGVAKRPSNARALMSLGTALAKEGKDDEAGPYFTKALELVPDYVDALNNLGGMHIRKGRFADAIPLYRKAIGLNPNHVDARYNLALALQSIGNLDEAEQGYREVLKRRPEHVKTHHNLAGVLLNQGRTQDAVAQFAEALRLDPAGVELLPSYALALNNLGASHDRQGRFADAIPLYRKAIESNPNYVDARYNLALTLQRLGNLDEAEKAYQEVLKLAPAHVSAHRNLAGIFLVRGRTEDAGTQLREVLRLDPTNEETRRTLATIQPARPQKPPEKP